MPAITVQLSNAGSHISAGRTAPVAVSAGSLVPPVTNTLPSGSKVALAYWRAKFIGLVYLHDGEGAVKSIVSAVLVAGVTEKLSVPPAISIFPVSYMAAVPLKRLPKREFPTVLQVPVPDVSR